MNDIATMENIFTLIGIGMLVGALLFYRSTRSFLAKALSTEGTVIDFIASRSTSSSSGTSSYTYQPVVVYTDANGDITQFVSSVGSNPPDYSVGERVEVLYLPGKTQEAKINSFFSLWGGVAILGALGGIFFLVGVGILLGFNI